MSEVEECDKSFYEEMYGINFKELYNKINDMMYEVRTNDSPEKIAGFGSKNRVNVD